MKELGLEKSRPGCPGKGVKQVYKSNPRPDSARSAINTGALALP